MVHFGAVKVCWLLFVLSYYSKDLFLSQSLHSALITVEGWAEWILLHQLHGPMLIKIPPLWWCAIQNVCLLQLPLQRVHRHDILTHFFVMLQSGSDPFIRTSWMPLPKSNGAGKHGSLCAQKEKTGSSV